MAKTEPAFFFFFFFAANVSCAQKAEIKQTGKLGWTGGWGGGAVTEGPSFRLCVE